MNRNEIIRKLEAFPYPREDWWVITGGAMVLYGFRAQATDVDLGCTSALADRLEAEGYLRGRTDDGKRRFRYGDDVELYEQWLCGSVRQVDGFPVVSVEGLLEMKLGLSREKDRRDVALIRAALARTGGSGAQAAELSGESEAQAAELSGESEAAELSGESG